MARILSPISMLMLSSMIASVASTTVLSLFGFITGEPLYGSVITQVWHHSLNLPVPSYTAYSSTDLRHYIIRNSVYTYHSLFALCLRHYYSIYLPDRSIHRIL
jgi:hypothetical protein